MPRFMGLAGTPGREYLDPPGLTPADYADNLHPLTGQSIPDGAEGWQGPVGVDGERTTQAQMYPTTQIRVMKANRAGYAYTPAASYAAVDPQKGGAPGRPDESSGITSQGPSGITVAGGVPQSPLKISYGLADWQAEIPTFVGAHVKIMYNANPNRPQVNPTPFNTEGPQQNTNYTTPAPWAVGSYIG